MNSEAFEVNLGADGGTKSFQSVKDVEDWLTNEQQFWSFLQRTVRDANEQRIWREFQACFESVSNLLTEAKHEQDRANVSQQEFDINRFNSRVGSLFQQHYAQRRLLSSNSPRAKFLAALKTGSRPAIAFFACAYFMRLEINYGTLDGIEGALTAFGYEQGLTNTIQSEKEALTELRSNWEKTFRGFQSSLDVDSETHKQLNADASSLLSNQRTTFDDLIAKEKKDWANLHKTYDEMLALAKPVQYWANKAKQHRCLATWFGIVALLAGGGVFALLFSLIEITLKTPAGVAKPADWHPEYWRVAVLIAAGVFSVWVVRIFVQLFLSNVHLLTDANERVTMARTYLALMKRDAGIKGEDRQLILQTLFRPAATGVVKDEGVPLSVIEAATKLGR